MMNFIFVLTLLAKLVFLEKLKVSFHPLEYMFVQFGHLIFLCTHNANKLLTCVSSIVKHPDQTSVPRIFRQFKVTPILYSVAVTWQRHHMPARRKLKTYWNLSFL